jgi:hypothetical protein
MVEEFGDEKQALAWAAFSDPTVSPTFLIISVVSNFAATLMLRLGYQHIIKTSITSV